MNIREVNKAWLIGFLSGIVSTMVAFFLAADLYVLIRSLFFNGN